MARPSAHRRGSPRRASCSCSWSCSAAAPAAQYHLLFENGGQLVSGNQVLVAGQPIGTVDDVTLTDDAQAEVTISVDEPLHEGTTAVIRATSLSGIANRYVSITPGPNNAPELADGATLDRRARPPRPSTSTSSSTPSARAPATALQNVIQGSAALYDGHTARRAQHLQVLRPGAVDDPAPVRRADQRQPGVQPVPRPGLAGARTRSPSAATTSSALTANANQALGAIASQNNALDRSLVAFPPALRQANTTFVNLRAALDDLTPLVNESKPATKDLAPFLRKLRPVAAAIGPRAPRPAAGDQPARARTTT